MSTKKSTGSTTEGPTQSPAPVKTRKPRKSKSTGPSWYKVSLSDGTYRIIEADSLDAAAAAVVTVTPAGPDEFAQAGADKVPLERKPTTA